MNIKKVLYLTHPEMCHLEYHIFNGLCEILGDENVITYPLKRIYFGEVADDYVLDSGQKGFTEPPEYILPRKKIEKSMEEIKKEVDTFDLILFSNRTYARRALDELRNLITQPLALVDGEDGDDIKWDLVRRYKPDFYFKREYLRGQQIKYPTSFQPPIIPLPFAAVDNTRPIVDDVQKEISVFSVHGFTNEMRGRATELLLSYGIPNAYVWINQDFYFSKFNPYTEEELKKTTRFGYIDFLKMIAKSKIGVAVRGWGRDTLRRWEIPMYETLLFTHDIGLEDPNPFEDGKTCVMFKNDFSDFKEKIQYYLENENERIKIARAGKEHLYRYHTTEKRVNYMLEHIK